MATIASSYHCLFKWFESWLVESLTWQLTRFTMIKSKLTIFVAILSFRIVGSNLDVNSYLQLQPNLLQVHRKDCVKTSPQISEQISSFQSLWSCLNCLKCMLNCESLKNIHAKKEWEIPKSNLIKLEKQSFGIPKHVVIHPRGKFHSYTNLMYLTLFHYISS